mmetsp:Transcript_36484/g.85737  ORF Transcript_36484/g.85737 Transcript_36484/m.85737 type:complete len:237 (-) Transcript_36484:52-762(-)
MGAFSPADHPLHAAVSLLRWRVSPRKRRAARLRRALETHWPASRRRWTIWRRRWRRRRARRRRRRGRRRCLGTESRRYAPPLRLTWRSWRRSWTRGRSCRPTTSPCSWRPRTSRRASGRYRWRRTATGSAATTSLPRWRSRSLTRTRGLSSTPATPSPRASGSRTLGQSTSSGGRWERWGRSPPGRSTSAAPSPAGPPTPSSCRQQATCPATRRSSRPPSSAASSSPASSPSPRPS